MNPPELCRLISRKKDPSSKRRTLQSGQSMVLIALMMFVFVGMMAVIFDGGYAYLQRRNAQTAADAGALAGARVLCRTGDIVLAQQAALDYAINRNRALEADIVIIGGEVEVTARIPFATFFGSLLGRPTITSSAIAAANCFAPGTGTGVLPLAWNCPPENTEMDIWGNEYCDMQTEDPDCVGDADCEPELYIIMNSRKAGDEDPFCLPEGTVNCDVDGDDHNELLVGGNRSWLDLSGGGGGSSELVDWIENGFPGMVRFHTWFAGQAGVANNIFMSVESLIGQEVLLPVYNAISDGLPPYPYDHVIDTTVVTGGTWTTYYHIISFSVFVPTCVHATGGDSCYMYDMLRADGILKPDDKTIEGYFVNGNVTGLGGQGELDAGAFTLYLTR